MSNAKALRSEPTNAARLPLGEIGGGRVVRAYRRGKEFVRVGTELSATDIAAIHPANRQALLGRFIAVWPKPSGGAVTPPAPSGDIGAGLAERHVVALGFGRYTVIEGRALTDKPISREDAYALAGKPLPTSKTN